MAPEDSGPLVTISGKTVAFAPLLRTRKTMNYGICHSSWTLCQPHPLVWDYSFWGGKEAFRHYCNIQTGHRPALPWERIVPPPFLDDWKTFIEALQQRVVAPQLILTRLSLRYCPCLSAAP